MTNQKGESKFNRSKFKDSVKSDELKAADKSVESIVKSSEKGNYAGFLSLEQGFNKFLLFPSHESIKQMMVENGQEIKNEPFVVSKQIFWLPREVEEKDDNGNVKKDKKGKSIMKIVNTPIFDARIHSEAKRDIVDFYITTLKKQFADEYGTDRTAEEKIKEKMLPIYGSYAKRVMGIVAKPSWIMYAEKLVGNQRVFGRFEIGKAIKMRINELIAIEESNQPIGSESNNPFTDIEDRRAIIIKYNKDVDDPKLVYITEIDSSFDSLTKVINTYPFSDSELEDFLKFPALSEMYKNSYTKKDFDLAINGLKIFDDKHEFGVFLNEDFLDEAEEMRNLYPESKEKEVVVSQSEDDEVESEDQFENMDREDLKKYSRENKTGIAIHSKLTDEDLRTQLKEWHNNNNQEEKSSEDEVEPSDLDILDEVPNHLVEKEERPLSKAQQKIAEIKAKANKN